MTEMDEINKIRSMASDITVDMVKTTEVSLAVIKLMSENKLNPLEVEVCILLINKTKLLQEMQHLGKR